MKKCLFHYPGEIANTPSAGSDLRPKMMLDAFKENGYEVTEITGYGAERKEKMKKIQEDRRTIFAIGTDMKSITENVVAQAVGTALSIGGSCDVKA